MLSKPRNYYSMTPTITARELELTDALQNYALKRFETMGRYFQNILDSHIELGRESKHRNQGKIFRASVTVKVPGKTLHVEHVDDDMYKAIDKIQQAMKQEIKKYKEKKHIKSPMAG